MTPDDDLAVHLKNARMLLGEFCLIEPDDQMTGVWAEFFAQEPSTEPLTIAALHHALESVWSMLGDE